MDKYIKSICDRCEKEGSVRLEDILKEQIRFNPVGLPPGWKYRDLGDIGPEPFELCKECWAEYVKMEENFFRTFIRSIVIKDRL